MKIGPNVFSIQQVVSSSVELLMCILIIMFFRRLHAQRAKTNLEDKESEALKLDDEMTNTKEYNDNENGDDVDEDGIKMDEMQ